MNRTNANSAFVDGIYRTISILCGSQVVSTKKDCCTRKNPSAAASLPLFPLHYFFPLQSECFVRAANFSGVNKKIPPTKRWTGKASMLLISCAAVPESIVKLRTGQDVAGVAVGFVGQDIASFGLLNPDILYIFLDDVAEKFEAVSVSELSRTLPRNSFSSPRIRVAVKMLLSVMIVPPFRFAILLSASEVWEPCCQGYSPKTLPFPHTDIQPQPDTA